ncbi:hypothetical protein [Clostridium tetani]|nr:hypothetical protein [Clostridium tetani]
MGKYTIRVTNPEMIPRIQEKLTVILAELTLEKEGKTLSEDIKCKYNLN